MFVLVETVTIVSALITHLTRSCGNLTLQCSGTIGLISLGYELLQTRAELMKICVAIYPFAARR